MKITFGAIHLLVAIGVILIGLAFVKAAWRAPFSPAGAGQANVLRGTGRRLFARTMFSYHGRSMA